MAAKKHTPHNARARKGHKGSKLHRNRHRSRRAFSPRRAAGSEAAGCHGLEDSLGIHQRALQAAMSAIIVSIAALRRQNSDIDADVALVLERAAADALD